MKDLSTTLRLVIIVMLLLSFAAIVRQSFVESSDEQRFEVAFNSEVESGAKPAPLPAKLNLYPSVPIVLPDLNDDYLFSRDRKFEKVEENMVRTDAGTDDLTEVTYVGSLIVGEVHKGLITYQEKSLAARRTAGSRRTASRITKSSGNTGHTNKQLTLGQNFMGYIVDKIEKDRIVFKKGDDVIEKFLHDPSKKRVVGGTVAKAASAKQARSVPKTVRRTAQRVPAQSTRRTVSSPSGATPSMDKLKSLRAERLLRLDPSLGVPGDPMRR